MIEVDKTYTRNWEQSEGHINKGINTKNMHTPGRFWSKCRKMVKYFLDRGYPQELITSSLAKAQNQDRSELRTPKSTDLSQPTKNDSLFAISTYHPSFDGLKTTINTHWDYLTRNMSTRSIHTQEKNLRIP